MSVVRFSKDKRAISIMIGYILLITGAVVMGAIVYQWMKTYVPKDAIDCPEGVSLFLSESSCTEFTNNYELKLISKNNGRFDVGGYFIYATDSPEQELAAVDLSDSLTSGGENLSSAVIFQGWYNNHLEPGRDIQTTFSFSDEIYSIEIVPIRFQVHENKKTLVSCSDAKITENIKCGLPAATCVPDCSGKTCGDNGCGGSCGTCDSGFKCEVNSCVVDLCGNNVVDSGEECDGVTGCGSDCKALDEYNCFPSTNTCYTV